MDKVMKIEDEIKKSLGDNCACYVLVTCTEPDKDGKMDVQMHYEGDEMLASFLIDNAAQVFDERKKTKESK